MNIRSIIAAVIPTGNVQRVVLALSIATAGVQTIRLSDAQADVARAETQVSKLKADHETEKARLWNEYVTSLEEVRKASSASSQAAVDDEAARVLSLVEQAAKNQKLKETHGATPLTPLQRAYLDRVRAERLRAKAR